MRTAATLVISVLGCQCLVVGCQSSASVKTQTAEARSSPLVAAVRAGDDISRCEYKGRTDRDVEESSSRGALRPNIRRVYALVGEGEERKKFLLCREVDTNLDGIKDVVRTFNDKGESLREVADANYDGKIDTWITFAHGRMAKVDLDRDGNGQPDEWRYYIQGKLARIQRDTNHDGRPDVWEIYDDGVLKRMGWDLDFDGRVDRWDRDEIAERVAIEKEMQDEEQRKKDEAAKKKDEASSDNAGASTKTGKSGQTPVSGHVSARKR
jgi:hypothetical protein